MFFYFNTTCAGFINAMILHLICNFREDKQDKIPGPISSDTARKDLMLQSLWMDDILF